MTASSSRGYLAKRFARCGSAQICGHILIRDVRMIVDNLKSRAVKDRRPLWFGKAILIFKFGIEYRLIIRIRVSVVIKLINRRVVEGPMIVMPDHHAHIPGIFQHGTKCQHSGRSMLGGIWDRTQFDTTKSRLRSGRNGLSVTSVTIESKLQAL